MKRWPMIAGVLGAGALLFGHDVISTKITWSREISRLVYARCVSCHRAGGAAFSLETWSAARPWAKAIKEEVLARRMPPWGAVKGYGEFSGDISLSQEEMDTIAQWVEGGAPEGDTALLPKSAAVAGPCFGPPPAGRRIAVNGETRLNGDSEVLAIRPSADVGPSARVTARLPDGSENPMLWAYEYRRAFAHSFVYKEPVRLPAGTVIRSEPPIPFELRVALR